MKIFLSCCIALLSNAGQALASSSHGGGEAMASLSHTAFGYAALAFFAFSYLLVILE